MPQNQVQPTIFPLKMSCTKSGISGHCYILVRFSVCIAFWHCVSVVSFVFSCFWVWVHIAIKRVTVLVCPRFMCLVLVLYLLFSWDFVWCLFRFCVCYILVLCRCSPLVFNMFPSVLVCCPDFVFCPWIYEFWTAIYYCCLTPFILNIPFWYLSALFLKSPNNNHGWTDPRYIWHNFLIWYVVHLCCSFWHFNCFGLITYYESHVDETRILITILGIIIGEIDNSKWI